MNIGLDDLIWIVLVILFVVVPAIGQMLAKAKQGQAGRGGAQPGPPGQQQPQKDLADEIGEFLRRAAQKRGAGAGQPQAQQQRPQQQRPQQQRPQQQRPAPKPVQVEVIEPERPPVGEGLKQRVAQDVDTTKFKTQAAGLGRVAAQSEAKTKERLRKKFDRKLGQLERKRSAVEEAASPEDGTLFIPATGAAGLAALLSEPQALRQAVVLHEILKRPEDRW
jgi:hypothetical protein